MYIYMYMYIYNVNVKYGKACTDAQTAAEQLCRCRRAIKYSRPRLNLDIVRDINARRNQRRLRCSHCSAFSVRFCTFVLVK